MKAAVLTTFPMPPLHLLPPPCPSLERTTHWMSSVPYCMGLMQSFVLRRRWAMPEKFTLVEFITCWRWQLSHLNMHRKMVVTVFLSITIIQLFAGLVTQSGQLSAMCHALPMCRTVPLHSEHDACRVEHLNEWNLKKLCLCLQSIVYVCIEKLILL